MTNNSPQIMPKYCTMTKSTCSYFELRATVSKLKCATPNMNAGFVESCAVTDFRALCLPMNALYRIAGMNCTITEMRADRLYLAGKRC